MTVIRDEETCGLFMIPLFSDWKIRRCNVKDCTEQPTTIVTHIIESPFGLCEHHYQDVVNACEYNFTLVFDDFDAFKVLV